MQSRGTGREEYQGYSYSNQGRNIDQGRNMAQTSEISYSWDEGLAATAAAYSNLPPRHDMYNSHYPPAPSQRQVACPDSGYSSRSQDMGSSSLTSSPSSETYQLEGEAGTSDGSAPLHNWVQVGNVTTTRLLSHLVREDVSTGNGVRTFLCGWQGCTHPVGFPIKSQLVTHIRSVHLQEKPFLCTTCKTPFARKQDAVRHVTTANSGTRYPCNVCSKTFARKSYRDSHQDICDLRTMVINRARTHPQPTYPPTYPPYPDPRYHH